MTSNGKSKGRTCNLQGNSSEERTTLPAWCLSWHPTACVHRSTIQENESHLNVITSEYGRQQFCLFVKRDLNIFCRSLWNG
jgi:hypothetical protein